MAKFLTSNQLNSELEHLLEQAEERIVLVSPYIKLHERYQSVLKTKLDKQKLKLVVVFGKNEDDISRSMREEDFNFFKEFPNVEIRYEKRLHAKYYANEKDAILTSMNLYSFSQDNNIEAGVKTSSSILANLASSIVPDIVGEDTLDNQASRYFQRVVSQSELLFQKTPQFDNGTFGIGLGKKYLSSKTEVDQLSDFFENSRGYKYGGNSWKNSKSKKAAGKSKSKFNSHKPTGFCIRTGKEIPFDPEKPMSAQAFKSWSRYGDPDYKEKYCHFSGEPSNGKTSANKPILKEYWKEAKAVFDF